MTSVRAQMTGQIVCADTAVKEPFVVAGSATRGRGDASEKRCPAAKTDRTDERQRRVADLECEIQLQQTQITAKGTWLQQYNSREMEVEDASR